MMVKLVGRGVVVGLTTRDRGGEVRCLRRRSRGIRVLIPFVENVIVATPSLFNAGLVLNVIKWGTWRGIVGGMLAPGRLWMWHRWP